MMKDGPEEDVNGLPPIINLSCRARCVINEDVQAVRIVCQTHIQVAG